MAPSWVFPRFLSSLGTAPAHGAPQLRFDLMMVEYCLGQVKQNSMEEVGARREGGQPDRMADRRGTGSVKRSGWMALQQGLRAEQRHDRESEMGRRQAWRRRDP